MNYEIDATNSGFTCDYKERKYIVKDLMENYLHEGKTYKEVIDLLNEPLFQSNIERPYYKQDTMILKYVIEMEGWFIMSGADSYPHKLSRLYIAFDKDSILTRKWVE